MRMVNKIPNVNLVAGENFVPLSAPPFDPAAINGWAIVVPSGTYGAVRPRGAHFAGLVGTANGEALLVVYEPPSPEAPQSVTCTIVWHEVS